MGSEKDNFFRFLCLITEVVAEVFRCRLKQSYKNSHVQSLPSFLKNTGVLHTIFHLFFPRHLCCWKGCRTQLSSNVSIKQWNILYDSDPSRCCNQNQKDPSKICLCCVSPKNVDESDLDLSLLSLILINCCNLMPNEAEAVHRLRDMKNVFFSHNRNCSLSQLDFESLLENTKIYTQHLDSTNIYLKNHLNVLNRPLDESLMQKYFMYGLESMSMEQVRNEQMKRVHAGIEHVKRENENLIEAVKELKSSFRHHQRDEEEHGIKTKRKRQEMSECFDAPNEQDNEDDCISTKIKVQKLMKLSGNTDDRIYKQPDTKPFDLKREFISSKLFGSDVSTAINLQMDYTVFTMKDLSKQPGFKEMDKFICGKCSWLFTSLDQFMQHKVECINKQKENELVKNEYKNYINSRITIPTKDQDLSHKIVRDWQQGNLDPKHNSMEVEYITEGCVVIWIKVDVLLFLDSKHFYSALDDLVNDIFQKYAAKSPFYRVQIFDLATGYVDHNADEFCCGDCKLKCNTLDKFISHKNEKCFQHLHTENDVICPMDLTSNEYGWLLEESNVPLYSSIAVEPINWCDDTIQKAQPPTKSHNTTTNIANNFSKEQLIAYEQCLLEWIVLRSQVVKELNLLADYFDQHFQKIAKAKIGGSAAGIVGSVMATVGFGLAFVTFGASLGLVIAGGVIAGAGGLTVGGSAATDAILSRKRKRAAEELIKKYNTKLDEVKNRYLEIHVELQKRAELSNLGSRIEEKFPHWIKFWWNLVKGAGQVGWSTGGSIIYTTIKSSFQIATAFDDAAITGLRVGGGVVKTFGTVGRAFHVVEGVANIVFLPLDNFMLIAIDVHKKNPHKISSAMRKLAIQIEKECPKKDSIQTMIAETLKQLEKE